MARKAAVQMFHISPLAAARSASRVNVRFKDCLLVHQDVKKQIMTPQISLCGYEQL